MATLVKQLLIKVWHNGKVYHSLECCFSSAFKLLFKVAATTSQVERTANNTVSVHSGIEPTLCSSLSCLTCLCLLKEPDVSGKDKSIELQEVKGEKNCNYRQLTT